MGGTPLGKVLYLVLGVLGAKTMSEYGSAIFDWGGRQLLLGGG